MSFGMLKYEISLKVLSVLDGGEVNFEKSEKNVVPCKLYTVEKEELSVLFELCEEK